MTRGKRHRQRPLAARTRSSSPPPPFLWTLAQVVSLQTLRMQPQIWVTGLCQCTSTQIHLLFLFQHQLRSKRTFLKSLMPRQRSRHQQHHPHRHCSPCTMTFTILYCPSQVTRNLSTATLRVTPRAYWMPSAARPQQHNHQQHHPITHQNRTPIVAFSRRCMSRPSVCSSCRLT
jgi:hypothetical protein